MNPEEIPAALALFFGASLLTATVAAFMGWCFGLAI